MTYDASSFSPYLPPELIDVIELLSRTLQNDTATVKGATHALLSQSQTDPDFSLKLLHVALSHQIIPENIRRTASVYLKNMASDSDVTIHPEVRQRLLSESLQFLASPENDIRTAATTIISTYLPPENYSSILSCVELIHSAVEKNDKYAVDGSVRLFSTILTDNLPHMTDQDRNMIQDRSTDLLMKAANVSNTSETIVLILRNLSHFITFSKSINEQQSSNIFQFCTVFAQNEDPAIKSEAIDTFTAFIFVCDRIPLKKVVQNNFVPLLDFMISCLHTDNEEIIRSALAFFVHLDDLSDLDSNREIPQRFNILIPLLIKHLRFRTDDLHFYNIEMFDTGTSTQDDSAIPVLWASSGRDDDEEDEDNELDDIDDEFEQFRAVGMFTARKAASSCLDVMGEVYKMDIIPIVTETLNAIIALSQQPQEESKDNSADMGVSPSDLVETALLALGCLATPFSLAAVHFPDQLNNILLWVFTQTASTFPLVRLRATWVIGEFASWIVGPLGTQHDKTKLAQKNDRQNEALDNEDDDSDDDYNAPHAPTADLLEQTLQILGTLVKDPLTRIQQTAVYGLRMLIMRAPTALSGLAPQFFTIFADVFMTSPPTVQLVAARSVMVLIVNYPDLVQDASNFEESTPLAVMLLAIINNVQSCQEGREQYNTHLVSLLQDVIEMGGSNVPIPVVTSIVNAVLTFGQKRLDKLAQNQNVEGKMGSTMTNSLTMCLAVFEEIVSAFREQTTSILAPFVESQFIVRCATLATDDDCIGSLLSLVGTCARLNFSLLTNSLDTILTLLHQTHIWTTSKLKTTANAVWCFGEVLFYSKGQLNFPFPLETYLELVVMLFTRDNTTTVDDDFVKQKKKKDESLISYATSNEQGRLILLNASQTICHFFQVELDRTISFLTSFQFPLTEKHPHPYPAPIRYILVFLMGFKDIHFEEKEIAYLGLAKAAQLHPMAFAPFIKTFLQVAANWGKKPGDHVRSEMAQSLVSLRNLFSQANDWNRFYSTIPEKIRGKLSKLYNF
ncbi:hypothetical protein BLNAU_16889 [Blattamonas nauphoetae]|uniref:Importin N-terminal domain-containing protein n=1 Tax=Blattamonas nauphoetae TaxID=2049346 RepID=A0ABQ9XAD3_9EUKA|nr:hypothetical protein BLNAU_16889 [Blattamonas nauphoetae]